MYEAVDWIAVGVAVALFLFGLVLVVWPFRATDGPRTSTRILLVFLRLAIAWHFFVEGMDKLHSATWTSENYLREATGPLAPTFRSLAGDRVLDRLPTETDKSFPEKLDEDWQSYFEIFTDFYRLDEQQIERAQSALEQTKKDVELFMSTRTKTVEKPSAYPPALTVNWTIPQRVAEYHRLQERVREVERDLLLSYGSEGVEPWKTAKANANRWRAALQKDLTTINKEMKRTLQNLLLDFAGESLPVEYRKKVQENLNKIQALALAEITGVALTNWDELDRVKDKWAEKTAEVYRNAFFSHDQANPKLAEKRDEQTSRIIANVLEKRKSGLPTIDPLPFGVTRPYRSWTLLDWSDVVVKYGILTVGLLLLVGLFTRTACVAGATFLLLFYLAMPPLPGWPESPRTEGHYLFVNKNIIEMLALLVLATTHSGRWAGLDALCQFCCPGRWRSQRTPVNMERSAQPV